MADPTAMVIVQDCLELLQVYAPGETISDADAQRTLSVLNDMLDVWSNLTLSCFTILEQSFPLVAGQQQYTVGPGGQINGQRPLKVLDGPGTAYVQDFNGNNYGVSVVARDQWNLYGNRSELITSDFPDTLFYDPQYPLGIINVMPVPTINYTMFFDSYSQLGDLSSLTAILSLPPGYKRAITTNLAVSVKPYFKTGQLDPLIIAEAMKTHGDIKRTNMRPNVAVMEPELVSRAQISYNPYTDRQGSSSS
jgi:hypothetical protein